MSHSAFTAARPAQTVRTKPTMSNHHLAVSVWATAVATVPAIVVATPACSIITSAGSPLDRADHGDEAHEEERDGQFP